MFLVSHVEFTFPCSLLDKPPWLHISHLIPLAITPIFFLSFLKVIYSVSIVRVLRTLRGRLDSPFLRRLEMYHVLDNILNFSPHRTNSKTHVVMSHD